MKQFVNRSIVALAILLLSAPVRAETLTVYCGRGQDLIGPLLEQFEQSSGIDLEVRYGGTAELAVTILEEGGRSPADLYIGQDAGALGALSKAGVFATLPGDIMQAVPERFRSSASTWVGISGRARVVVYNTERLTEADLPATLEGFTDPAWKGRLGWAPENGSFQSFVTALSVERGRDAALAWLRGIHANEPRVYAKNSAIVAAVAAGEIDAGLVNHYYLYSARRSRPDITAANYYLPGESAGNLVNVAGVGVLASSEKKDAALALVNFLLSENAQQYFVEKTAEYPVLESVPVAGDLKPLNMVPTLSIDLNDLDDLEATLQLIHEAGVL
jgi:iron(III) transport system substrate-binding protein